MPVTSSISTRLQYQHKSLLELIEGLTDEQIRKQVIAGKWSIFEQIVHLATYQRVFCTRIKKILAESKPVFSRYTAEADPIFLDNCCKSTREIMQDLLSTRKDMAAGLPALADDELKKTGEHPAYGEMDILQWLNFFLLHEAHHLYSVLKLAAMLRNNTN